jgi:hypothetical protein
MNFKHSGALGDIIYSLPILQKKWQDTGERQMLYVALDVPATFYPVKKNLFKKILFRIPERINFEFSKRNKKEPFDLRNLYDRFYPRVFHPAKNVRMNEWGYNSIRPLLLQQPYIADVKIYAGENIDVNLDEFRNLSVDYTNGDIASWHIQATGIHANLDLPWLIYKKDSTYKDAIVLGRSARYRNDDIDYSVLEKCSECIYFVGLLSEYDDMKQIVPKLIYRPTSNAAELASIIGSSKIYIGNGSFAFAIAEGIKNKRFYEECPWCKSVKPKQNSFLFTNQNSFENLLSQYTTYSLHD